MADDSELEKRAIDELLRETNRARVRAETMGPAGWMKCPLRSTNKHFLLNTLRSTGLQTSGPTAGQSTTRGRPRSESHSQDRSRSRTPPRDHRANGGHGDHKHHGDSSNNDDTRHNRDKDKRYRQKDIASRDQRHRKDDHNRDRFQCRDLSPGEGHSSSRGHSLSREYCRSHHSLGSSCNCSLTTRHAPQSCWKFDRSRSRSPVGDVYSKRSQK